MYFNGDLDIKNEATREDYIDNWMNLVIGVISKASDDYRLERKRMLKIEKELQILHGPGAEGNPPEGPAVGTDNC